MKAIILAAGKGTRLQPLSNYVSKAMMPVANIPITQRLVEQIHDETGIDDFIILASGEAQDVVKHFIALPKSDEQFEKLRFSFIYQSEQRGMGHAVKCVYDAVTIDEPVLLAACDSLYPKGDIAKLIRKSDSASLDGIFALMELPVGKLAKSSSVEIRNGIVTRIVEKPSSDEILSNYASLPLYVLDPKLQKYLNTIKPSKRGELELQDAFQAWISDGGRFGYGITSGRDTITTIFDLIKLNIKYLRTMPSASENLWDDAMVVEPVLSAKKVYVGAGSVMGPDVVIGESSKIGKNCTVKNAVIFAGSFVPDGTAIENGCWHKDMFFPA